MKRQPTIQDVTWFLDLHRNDRLDLDPPYQRKSVWNLKDKRYFLDSVLNDYPCPPIFLHRELDDNGTATYHVVDGKQRLQAIIGFTNNEFTLDKDFGNTDLNGKSWDEIPTEYKRKLWDYVLSIEYINDINDTATVNEIFDRVNRNQKKLDPQELRHAKYSGWFATRAENETNEAFWKAMGIVTTARARRMKDIQFVSELLLVVIEGDIRGFSQEVLDAKYAAYDDPETGVFEFSKEDFESSLHDTKEILELFEKTNAAVTKHAKSFSHFYTLWSCVALNLDAIKGNERSIAEKYDTFMTEVKDASKDETGSHEKPVLDYVNNSVGASTDLKQRTQRMVALKTALGL